MHPATVLIIGLILAYGFILARYIPDKLHLIANSVAALLAVGFGIWNGLDFETLGLNLHLATKGIVVTAACSVGIMLIAGVVALLVPGRQLSKLPQVMRPGKIAYETAVRIPLSTALSEEILFRGVLLAMLLQHSSAVTSVIICSIVFGLWHVMPSSRDHRESAVLPIILATAVAGVFFCWLRIVAGSIIAPWLVHWTVNAAALLAIHGVHKKVRQP